MPCDEGYEYAFNGVIGVNTYDNKDVSLSSGNLYVASENPHSD